MFVSVLFAVVLVESLTAENTRRNLNPFRIKIKMSPNHNKVKD
jgi:hypothetical protein